MTQRAGRPRPGRPDQPEVEGTIRVRTCRRPPRRGVLVVATMPWAPESRGTREGRRRQEQDRRPRPLQPRQPAGVRAVHTRVDHRPVPAPEQPLDVGIAAAGGQYLGTSPRLPPAGARCSRSILRLSTPGLCAGSRPPRHWAATRLWTGRETLVDPRHLVPGIRQGMTTRAGPAAPPGGPDRPRCSPRIGVGGSGHDGADGPGVGVLRPWPCRCRCRRTSRRRSPAPRLPGCRPAPARCWRRRRRGPSCPQGSRPARTRSSRRRRCSPR